MCIKTSRARTYVCSRSFVAKDGAACEPSPAACASQTVQRKAWRHDQLSAQRLSKLTKAGIVWDTYQDQWEEGFAQFSKLKKDKNGIRRTSRFHVAANGFRRAESPNRAHSNLCVEFPHPIHFFKSSWSIDRPIGRPVIRSISLPITPSQSLPPDHSLPINLPPHRPPNRPPNRPPQPGTGSASGSTRSASSTGRAS